MKKTQLSRLQRTAKNYDTNATVTHEKISGYFLILNNQKHSLGVDSVDAIFKLEKLLKRTKKQ